MHFKLDIITFDIINKSCYTTKRVFNSRLSNKIISDVDNETYWFALYHFPELKYFISLHSITLVEFLFTI